MDVETDPVAGRVGAEPGHRVAAAAVPDHPALGEPLGEHAGRLRVRRLPGAPRPHLVDGRALRLQHQLVEGALRRAEPSGDGPRPGHVGGVAPVLRPRVHQHEIALAKGAGVLGVVRPAGVGPARHDARIGEGPAAGAMELVQKLRLHLVLRETRPAGRHRAAVRALGQLDRPAHHAHLRPALVEPHLVHAGVQVHQLGRVRRAGAKPLEPAEHPRVEPGVLAHRVPDVRAVLQEAGQDLVDVVDGKRVVRAVSLAGALEARPRPVHPLLARIPLAAEEQVLAGLAARQEQGHRLRLRKPREIEEVAVRAVGVLDIAVAARHRGGGREDRAAFARVVEEPPAPPGVLAALDDRLPHGPGRGWRGATHGAILERFADRTKRGRRPAVGH